MPPQSPNIYVTMPGAGENDLDTNTGIYFTQEAQVALVEREAQRVVLEAKGRVPF